MKPIALSILSGILIGTSYIPFPPWAATFCFLPLWMAWLEENSWRQVFWTGWLMQFVSAMIGFNWIAHTVHEFGHLPWPIAGIVLLGFCSFANLHIPLAGLTWFFFSKKFKLQGFSRVWALVILTAFGERLFPMLFDWNMGYTWLWAGLPAFQLADLIGFIGLSTFIFMFNGLFLSAWILAREKRSWWREFVAVPILCVVINLAGYYHAEGKWNGDAKLRFLIVQANIGNAEKLLAEQGWAFRDTVINRFANLTLKGLSENGPADFVVWPETAFPEIIDQPSMTGVYPQKLKSFITQQSHTKLITGTYSRLLKTGQITNSFLILDENGNWLSSPYHKTKLLAFGEYMPLGATFPWLYKMLPEVGNYGRGPGPTVLQAGANRIGAQICYEGLFDWFAREQANLGAQVIVNLTNDSWYDMMEEPFQHGYITLAHAIETRRPVVRATNTGLSTVALANGEILAQSPLRQEWFHLYEVPYSLNPEATVFMSWGYWLIPVLLLLGLVGIVLRNRSEQSRLG